MVSHIRVGAPLPAKRALRAVSRNRHGVVPHGPQALGIGTVAWGLAGVMACALFAAVSGSSPATVVAIGSILLPAIVHAGFPKSFGAGVITTSGALGILIPPSSVMVMYSVATRASKSSHSGGPRAKITQFRCRLWSDQFANRCTRFQPSGVVHSQNPYDCNRCVAGLGFAPDLTLNFDGRPPSWLAPEDTQESLGLSKCLPVSCHSVLQLSMGATGLMSGSDGLFAVQQRTV